MKRLRISMSWKSLTTIILLLDYSANLLANKKLYILCVKETKRHQNWVATLQIMEDSQEKAELKNCKIGNPSCLFLHLVHYATRDKRRISSCIMHIRTVWNGSVTDRDNQINGAVSETLWIYKWHFGHKIVSKFQSK